MSAAAQLAMDYTGPSAPNPKRQRQRRQQRDRILDVLRDQRAEFIALAHGVALELRALDPNGEVTSPRVQDEMTRRGLLKADDRPRWLGGLFNDSGPWRCVRRVNEGSNYRSVGVWILREEGG